MSVPIITIKKVTAIIGVLPLMVPRSSETNIDALKTDLIDELSGIPSHQSRDKGYLGAIDKPAVFALCCATPWAWTPDPGPHQKVDPKLNREG